MKNNGIYSLMCVEILIITQYNILRIADGKFSYLSSSNTQGIFLLSKLISQYYYSFDIVIQNYLT